MPDSHLTRELLEALEQGELPLHAIAEIGLRHLMDLCPTCRREILEFKKGNRDLGMQDPRLEKEHSGAAQDFEELMTFPPEARTSRVLRARHRFKSPHLVRRLVEESQQRIRVDPKEAFQLAELGRVVAQQSQPAPVSFHLAALATAQMANARRAAGHLLEAEEHLRRARYVIADNKVTGFEVLARVDEIEGCLRKDQSRFEEAEGLYSRAAVLYRTGGSQIAAARVLLNLGSMRFHRGEVDRALEAVRVVLRKLPIRADRRLYLCAQHNFAFYLTEVGGFVQAAALVAKNKSLYEEFHDAWTQLRLLWLQGRIAAGYGETDRAIELFLAVRDGFAGHGNGYDAAMVSLELAVIYLKQGRTTDSRKLAEEIYPILLAQNVGREAAVALTLLREAAVQEG